MQVLLSVLAFLTALLPLANQGLQQYEQYQQRKQAQQLAQPVQYQTFRPVLENPPEAGQPNVVFHDGSWYKYEDGKWFVWRPAPTVPVYMAQGGNHVGR